MVLLTKGYIYLIMAALLLAIPLAYYFTEDWLNNFSFRTDLGVGIFVISGIIALAIGAFTVSIKSFQAANSNPVDKLRTE